MEKSAINIRLREVQNITDFAKLLNDVKVDEFGTSKYKITDKQLRHFSNPKIVSKRYKTFYLRKKSGGLREINAPCYQLALLLHVLNIVFKAVYTPCSSVMGFTENKSVVTNASMHTGHHYVFNIDLENFFPSIPQPRVKARLLLPPFNFPEDVANVIAGLCCHVNAEGTCNVLPQGAATSPLLTNAICDKLDRRMRGVAKRFGLHYSRYADDMTFSSMHNVYQEGSDFRNEIKRIIVDQGFTMNEKKTRLLRDGERQEVTGITVNEHVNLAKKYIRDLRCILHVWEKEGYGKAYAYFYPFYKHEKGYIKKGEPVMENVIGGKLNYMRMVKGANNSTYQHLLERYNKLQNLVFVDSETDKNEAYVYVQPYTLQEFEKLFQTKISLDLTSNQKLVGKCDMYGIEKVIPISMSTQKSFMKNGSENLSEILKSKGFRSSYVTLCRKKGKNHWLITKFQPKRSSCLSLQDVKVDIDALLEIWDELGVEAAAEAFAETINGKAAIKSMQIYAKKEK